ncbi:MAG TPA: anti-sigma factor [Casimicrobiaceae bacterium]|nr:anti-sigma factor [Casimicrobiaceae bacterium]
MNYDRPELLDRLAAEYVFGSMTPLARRRFHRLRRQLPAAEAAARDWERRLMPLSTVVPAEPPPSRLWDAIDQRTGGARTKSPSRGWRAWLQPALGLAFGVLATIGFVQLYPEALVPIDSIVQSRGTLPQSYVGLLTDAQNNPVLLLSSTRHGRTLAIKRLRPLDVPAGRIAVLWALPRDGRPFVVGALPSGEHATMPLADESEKLFFTVPRLAVSFESVQPGPDGAPGDFVLSGHCVKLW